MKVLLSPADQKSRPAVAGGCARGSRLDPVSNAPSTAPRSGRSSAPGGKSRAPRIRVGAPALAPHRAPLPGQMPAPSIAIGFAPVVASTNVTKLQPLVSLTPGPELGRPSGPIIWQLTPSQLIAQTSSRSMPIPESLRTPSSIEVGCPVPQETSDPGCEHNAMASDGVSFGVTVPGGSRLWPQSPGSSRCESRIA